MTDRMFKGAQGKGRSEPKSLEAIKVQQRKVLAGWLVFLKGKRVELVQHLKSSGGHDLASSHGPNERFEVDGGSSGYLRYDGSGPLDAFEIPELSVFPESASGGSGAAWGAGSAQPPSVPTPDGAQ